MGFTRDIECKYCGKTMFEDDVDRDYSGKVVAIYSVCDCMATCTQEKVNGFVKKIWYKEGVNT